MNPEDIKQYIEKLKVRFSEVEKELSDPNVYADQRKSKQLSLEHKKLAKLFKLVDDWCGALAGIQENKELLHLESDEELKEMIRMDIEELNEKASKLELEVRTALIPPDPNEGRNLILEIRPAAGGDEAGIFAGDMYRAYMRYAEIQGWKFEVLDMNSNDVGGLKDVTASITGDEVFGKMKYESGVHRVQRIPTTESGGRIHTSTVTVAVLPEAEDVDLHIAPEDLRFDVFRASGAGGQHVNTTDSAVRVTHIPTGLAVASQQEKSQHKNKEIALRILRSKLLEAIQAEEAAKNAASKKAQIGSGDRSERIRTYNYPQNRVTDHRFGVTLYDLPKIMEGEFDILLNEIMSIDCEKQLSDLLK
ncbi:peptide chain release factor 1 [Lentisphaerota bacterium WC36G]|nr:peptide chain release factor 1 [Lentisphaerae bacterium WC36]